MKNNGNSNTFRDVIYRKFLFFLSLTCFGANVAFAQLNIVPIGTYPGPETLDDNQNLRVEALSLPFFDDFATTHSHHPNSTYWLPGSGVYINNTLATSQPSRNFATFDGLNAAGIAYNDANPLLQGETDTLTSQSINLAGLSVADSVYLSFYWLAKGLGEKPDSADVLRLEFKDQAGKWIEAWFQDGNTTQDSSFSQQFVLIKEPHFLHADFQFRFRSYGRVTGPYDTWHLDYVYLNKNRSIKQPYLFDVATRRPITPLLKQYTSMPLKQYQAQGAASMSASVMADAQNNFDRFNVLGGTFTISNEKSGSQYFRAVQNSVSVGELKSAQFTVPLSAPDLSKEKDSVNLVTRFYLTTTDNVTPGVDLFRNDTITATTTLNNYYAFDDGSAEFGVQVNQKLSRAVLRFVIARPDTIAGIDMCIIPFNKNIVGQGFNIQIYGNRNGKPSEFPLAQRAVTARYPANRNGFVRYNFNTPVAVKDTFFVGWLQINEQPIVLGYDRNSQLGKDHIFFNLGTEWVQEKALNGSIMLRPVTGGKSAEPVLGVEPVSGRKNYFFPNPAQSIIKWEDTSFKNIDVYSVNGVLIKSVSGMKVERAMRIDDIPNGLYLFIASDGKRTYQQKVMILK
jgi:hypothetical protein